ncbi:peptidylprolyl isomerase [Dietzia aerolata]|uniref:Peptidyl-prolyl cis-trans isomerase n=1 Tax=Dietzia aerolata TaxID=595984 RepID=A0ABV5JMZ4_9ACTN|nr:peptidylprolyl isomerase [Dietzia aerolata]MBB0968638.1 peptidylprolyl isomerase [Dietzia aerolata]
MRLTTTARRRPTVRTALGVLALAAPLALAGCGSDDSGSDSATSGSSSDSSDSSSEAAADVECPPAEGTEERTTEFASAPPMCLTPGADYTAVITTDAGEVTVDLLEDKAPETVNNFVFLARNHFYDGITFHRVIPGFMIQGGDPQGTGAGGPGYDFDDELPAAGEYEIGSMAMANAGPNTNGSQFFIVTGDAGVALPPSYSLFGIVTEGMETVTAIEDDGSAQGAPSTTHTIESVQIIES